MTRPCTGSQCLAPPSRRASSNHKGLRPAEGLPGSEVMIQGLDSQQCWQRRTVSLTVPNHITVHTSAPHLREMKLHRLIPEPAQQEVASTFQIGVVFWQRKHHMAATGQFSPMGRAWSGLLGWSLTLGFLYKLQQVAQCILGALGCSALISMVLQCGCTCILNQSRPISETCQKFISFSKSQLHTIWRSMKKKSTSGLECVKEHTGLSPKPRPDTCFTAPSLS